MCAYVLQTLRLAVRATSMREWMWGWLGFAVEDAPAEKGEVGKTSEGGA
jgi:hypothetical protein